jgi:hypothetical protein
MVENSSTAVSTDPMADASLIRLVTVLAAMIWVHAGWLASADLPTAVFL